MSDDAPLFGGRFPDSPLERRELLLRERERLSQEVEEIRAGLAQAQGTTDGWRLKRELAYRESRLRRVEAELAGLLPLLEASEADLVLRIRLRARAARPGFQIDLLRHGRVLASGRKEFSSGHQFDPYFRDLFHVVENLQRDSRESGEAARRLEDKGTFLYRKLLPAEIGRCLTELKTGTASLHIDSDEPSIPWQMLRFPGGPFLAEGFDLTRSLAGRPKTAILKSRQVAAIVPRDSRLVQAAEELRFLERLAGRGCFKLTRITARFLPVREAFLQGMADVWHFSGHGVPHGDPDRARLLLEDEDEMTPEIVGGEGARLAERRPLVFLNGCSTGRGGFSLLGIGGWASVFLEAGAGAFLGSYWAIDDDRGRIFAEIFYDSLLTGLSLGRAVRRARLAVRSPEDPTWLAYTLFAAPTARCDFS